jgi:hypothetical protein
MSAMRVKQRVIPEMTKPIMTQKNGTVLRADKELY